MRGEGTQLDAVLRATPRALVLIGNISEGMVHAIGPQDTPYDNVNKSSLIHVNEDIHINIAQILPWVL